MTEYKLVSENAILTTGSLAHCWQYLGNLYPKATLYELTEKQIRICPLKAVDESDGTV